MQNETAQLFVSGLIYLHRTLTECHSLHWEVFREKSTKMHQMEHDAIFTESVQKVASIDTTNRSFESADVSAQNTQSHAHWNLLYMRAATPNSKSTTKTYMHIVHLGSPRELRTNVSGDTSESDFDAVFQGQQNCQRDLVSAWLPTLAMELRRVTTLLFRCFPILAEAAVLWTRLMKNRDNHQPT
jgi:hypothetical protein